MGLGDAGATFQTAVDNMLTGLPGVFTYSDDILVGGVTQEEHDARIAQVLQRLSDNNFRLKLSKLIIRTNTVPMLA